MDLTKKPRAVAKSLKIKAHLKALAKKIPQLRKASYESSMDIMINLRKQEFAIQRQEIIDTIKNAMKRGSTIKHYRSAMDRDVLLLERLKQQAIDVYNEHSTEMEDYDGS